MCVPCSRFPRSPRTKYSTICIFSRIKIRPPRALAAHPEQAMPPLADYPEEARPAFGLPKATCMQPTVVGGRSAEVAGVQVCSCTGRKGGVALVRVRSQRRSDGVAVLWSCGHSVAEMVSRCSGEVSLCPCPEPKNLLFVKRPPRPF